jgi:hypothetical protein
MFKLSRSKSQIFKQKLKMMIYPFVKVESNRFKYFIIKNLQILTCISAESSAILLTKKVVLASYSLLRVSCCDVRFAISLYSLNILFTYCTYIYSPQVWVSSFSHVFHTSYKIQIQDSKSGRQYQQTTVHDSLH